ncbi:MAG: hypothetical protein OXG82_04555 [Gammaproteobacteria bacterium]|nr:hypothetical protein [Gammaproteobacteria bacterium]
MKVKKLFQKTLFGIFVVFGCIGLATSILTVYTVDTHLSEEYQSNASNIAKTIADSSVDILLNRNLTALQSLIDQFVEIQGIKYIYIADEEGEFVAHTFVPGIPAEIRADDPQRTEPVERNLPGMGDFIEVGSPILAGVAGTVHVGMDTGLIALKIQRAIGRQVYLISIIFIVGVFAAIWLVNLAAKPMGGLLAYTVDVARQAGHAEPAAEGPELTAQAREKLLARSDEVGHIARLFSYLAELADQARPAGRDHPHSATVTGDPS